jgi:hypothetical protein
VTFRPAAVAATYRNLLRRIASAYPSLCFLQKSPFVPFAPEVPRQMQFSPNAAGLRRAQAGSDASGRTGADATSPTANAAGAFAGARSVDEEAAGEVRENGPPSVALLSPCVTVVFTVALLSAEVGCGEVVVIVEVFVMVVPAAVWPTLTTKVKLAVAFRPIDTKLAVTVPVCPTAGCVTIQPTGAAKDSKVVWAGTESLSANLVTVLSPLPVRTVMV